MLRDLNRRLDAGLTDPDPDGDGRRSLIVEAVHSVFLEAFVEDLPRYARDEREAGLTGPLRKRIAEADPDDRRLLQHLRGNLIEKLAGESGRSGAIRLADQIHLGRMRRSDVPVIVAAVCVIWYGSYRRESDPYATTAAKLFELYREWEVSVSDRPRIEAEMRLATGDVGDGRLDDLLDAGV